MEFIEGKSIRIVIASFPDMTVDEARKKVQQIKGQLAEVKSPLKEKEKVTAEKHLEKPIKCIWRATPK
jgi:hypothetical protein